MTTPLVSFGHYLVYPPINGFWLAFGIVWPLLCLSFDKRILITPLVSVDHYFFCPSINGFWLPLWYLLAITLSPSINGFWLPLWYLVAITLSVLRLTDSYSSFGILWPLLCLSFLLRILIPPFGILWPFLCLSFDWRILIPPLVSCGHCFVCPSLYGFWFHLLVSSSFSYNFKAHTIIANRQTKLRFEYVYCIRLLGTDISLTRFKKFNVQWQEAFY